MLSSNKIIALIFAICSLTVHVPNGFTYPLNEQQSVMRAPTETGSGSVDQLEINRLDDEVRLKTVAEQRFQLGATIMPPIFDSNYKPFIDLATRLPHIIRMFHDDNLMITDDMSATNIKEVIDFTTVEEESEYFDNEKQIENTTIEDQLIVNITDITGIKKQTKHTSIEDQLIVNITDITGIKQQTENTSIYNYTNITVKINIANTTGPSFTTAKTNGSSSAITNTSNIDLPPLPGNRYNFLDFDDGDEEVAGEKKKEKYTTPWPITDGAWRRTIFDLPELTIATDNKKFIRYTPDNNWKNFRTICLGRSTLYNDLKVWPYVNSDQTANTSFWYYPIDMILRKQIYNKGVSEYCHTPDMTDFLEYIQCAILRNMRMDSVHPSFPKIQLLYR